MNLTKLAGAILPTLNPRTLEVEGTKLRIYDNEGRLRPEIVEARSLLKSRSKHLKKLLKDLDAKLIADLKAGVKVAPGNHTLELGTKTNTSTSWKGYAVELLKVCDKKAEEMIKETEHYSSGEVDCLVIDGNKQ